MGSRADGSGIQNLIQMTYIRQVSGGKVGRWVDGVDEYTETQTVKSQGRITKHRWLASKHSDGSTSRLN